jgi:hypothetical protein
VRLIHDGTRARLVGPEDEDRPGPMVPEDWALDEGQLFPTLRGDVARSALIKSSSTVSLRIAPSMHFDPHGVKANSRANSLRCLTRSPHEAKLSDWRRHPSFAPVPMAIGDQGQSQYRLRDQTDRNGLSLRE